MAGKIVADTLEHSTAGSIATNYVVNGSAKAWADIEYSSGTPVTRGSGSFNIASYTDVSTGDYKANFSNSMSGTDYSASGMAVYNTRVLTYLDYNASYFRGAVYNLATSPTTASDSQSRFSILGELA
jgi:hypothetical protein